MTTKKSTTQKSHISLQRAAELTHCIRALQDKNELIFARTNDHQNRISALEDRVAFLTKQSSDAYRTAELSGKAIVNTREEMDKRLRDLAKTWIETKMVTDYVTNPACRPRDPQWVVMGYNSERMKVEVHGPFTYAEAERFCNDADYSGYAILPLEE